RAVQHPRALAAAARGNALRRQSAESRPSARAVARSGRDHRLRADARAGRRSHALRARSAPRRGSARRANPPHHFRSPRGPRARRRRAGHLPGKAERADDARGSGGARARAHGRAVKRLLIALAAAVASIAFLAACGAAFGHDPRELLSILASGSIGSRFALEGTLLKSVPLLLTGLSVAVAFRAGVWNIGAEGQFIAG